MSDQNIKYKRIMIKLSGEALMGDRPYGMEPDTLDRVAEEIKSVYELGVEIARRTNRVEGLDRLGAHAGKRRVRYDPEAVDVRCRRHRLAGDLLRRHERR